MESKTGTRIPKIDFSELETSNTQSDNEEWVSLRSQLKKAIEEFGCFEAMSTKFVPHHLQMAIFSSLKELFALPIETKKLNIIPKNPLHGYFGQVPAAAVCESLSIDHATATENIEKFTTSCWPQGNPSFSKTMQSFTEQVVELEQIIRKMIVEILGVEKYTDEHMNSTYFILRVTKYEEHQNLGRKVEKRPHIDKNAMTILYQNQVGGLDVKTKDGEWVHWEPSPNSFMVLIGESLNAWANGRLQVPYHRVTMTGEEQRYSLALLSVFKEGYMVKAPEELVDEQHPLLYKPFDYIEFLKFHHAEMRERDESAQNYFPLKARYGVK